MTYRSFTLAGLSVLTLAACDASSRGTGDGGSGIEDSGSGTDAATPADLGPRDVGPPPDRFVPPPPDVHVIITGDNAYGFGYGADSGLTSYFNGREAALACEIFCCSATCTTDSDCTTGTCDPFGTCNDDGRGAETYVVPGTETSREEYLYIVAWSDDAVTQGILGQFVADGVGTPHYTGDPDWEVCATGMDYDIGEGGPTTDVIDAQLGVCNEGGGTSMGWVGSEPRDGIALALGEPNEEGSDGDFPGVCTDPARGDSISSEALWMWFDQDVDDGMSAFRSSGSDGQGEFLIFRLRIQTLLI